MSSGAIRHYLVNNDLGSDDLLIDTAGAVDLRKSFDAYGKRRGSAWAGEPSAGELATMNATTRRGFTMHEHLDSTGLIHMNGRVYDPLIGRFGSADPVGERSVETQSWNRFGYVQNRPLSFTDPSGFWLTNVVCTGVEACASPAVTVTGHRSRGGGGGMNGGISLGGTIATSSASADQMDEVVVRASREDPEGEPEGDPGVPRVECTQSIPEIIVTGQLGVFGRVGGRIGPFAVSVDINLFRINIPTQGPSFLDQGLGAGVELLGREWTIGYERFSPGGLSWSDWSWYGQIDNARASQDGLTVDAGAGAGVGVEIEITNADSLLPSSDTPCRQPTDGG